MHRENKRIVNTKQMLKESMLKILKDKELESINVTELCREAGVNRATFYRHYAIPRDVLMDIQRDLHREIRQEISIPVEPEDIRSVVDKFSLFIHEHSELLRILFHNNSDADFASFINESYQEIIREYRNIGALHNMSEEDLRLLTLYHAGGTYFILRGWVMGTIKKSPREMADYFYSLMKKQSPS